MADGLPQLGYSYYHFSGAKSIVNAASTTKSQFNKLTQYLQNTAPEPNEALKWLRQTATSYSAFIPRAKSYVDSAFNYLESIQSKHGEEFDKLINDCYKELKDATKKGMSGETASQSWAILERDIKQLGDLAGDSTEEIMDNHPELKEKAGGNLKELKGMADSYGPEAKKELDQTYQEIKDVMKAGVSMESVNKVRQLVQEKTEKMRQLGDETWKRGLEQAKPYLEKNSQVREIVEKNADSLKQGKLRGIRSNFNNMSSKLARSMGR